MSNIRIMAACPATRLLLVSSACLALNGCGKDAPPPPVAVPPPAVTTNAVNENPVSWTETVELQARVARLTDDLAAMHRLKTEVQRRLKTELQDQENAAADVERARKAAAEYKIEFERFRRRAENAETAHAKLSQRLTATQVELGRAKGIQVRVEREYALLETQLKAAQAETRKYYEQLLEWEAYARQLEQKVAGLEGRAAAPRAAREPARNEYSPSETGPFSRRRFAYFVQGMTVQQLVNYIGRPDQVRGGTTQYYIYRNRGLTYVLEPDQPDPTVQVEISDGTVTRCHFPSE